MPSAGRHGVEEGGAEGAPAQRVAGARGDGMHMGCRPIGGGRGLGGCAVSMDVKTDFLVRVYTSNYEHNENMGNHGPLPGQCRYSSGEL